jgi:hypothetical protein
MEFDQQFVEYIVKALVNKPEEVKSDRKVDEQGVLITVHTSTEDTGYVIGKGGKTAVAIRTLLATLGAKGNQRISFRIDAPDNGKRRGPAPAGEMTMGAAAVGGSVAAAPMAEPAPAPDRDMDDASVDSLTF